MESVGGFDFSYIDQQIAKRKRAANTADPSPYIAKGKAKKTRKKHALKISRSVSSMRPPRDGSLPNIWARPGTPVEVQSLSKPSTPNTVSSNTTEQVRMFDPEVIEEKLLSLPFLDKTEYISLQLKKRGVELELDRPQDEQQQEEGKRLTRAEKEAKMKTERAEKEIAVAEERRKRKAEEDSELVRVRADAEKMVKSLNSDKSSRDSFAARSETVTPSMQKGKKRRKGEQVREQFQHTFHP